MATEGSMRVWRYLAAMNLAAEAQSVVFEADLATWQQQSAPSSQVISSVGDIS